MDVRIASIVLANDALLISRNLRDFERVPGLGVEDWPSRPEALFRQLTSTIDSKMPDSTQFQLAIHGGASR